MITNYLESAKKQFEYYKMLGEKTFLQLTDKQLFVQYNTESNSIAIIVKHLSGNMLSRWTDFMTTDGEKEWRQRDVEFENEDCDRNKILEIWNKGWACLFDTLSKLTENDLTKEVLIRSEKHTVLEAINRQLAHYPYHIGQIVFIGKMLCDQKWATLSVAKGKSKEFNKITNEKHQQS